MKLDFSQKTSTEEITCDTQI